MSLKKRLQKIEDELGAGQEKSYIIYLSHIPRPYAEGQPFHWEKDGEEVEHIIILERQGKRFLRQFDGCSEDGKKFLLESGYKQVPGPTNRVQKFLKAGEEEL